MDTPEEAAALVASSLRLRLQGGSVLAVLMLAVSLVFTLFYVRLLPRERWA